MNELSVPKPDRRGQRIGGASAFEFSQVAEFGPPLGLAIAACALFLWKLGAPSFFIDEVMSVTEAKAALAHTLSIVATHETSPPTFAVLLHYWLRLTGADSEFMLRLPSAIAGVGLVLAVWRLGRMLANRRTALIAGILTATSPLVLQYAQEARVYIFLMLGAVLSVIAAIKAVETVSRRWLWISLALIVLTGSLHYLGWIFVFPIVGWLTLQSRFSRRERLLFASVVSLAACAWIPEAVAQFSLYGNGGLGIWGALSRHNVQDVLAAPVIGRAAVPHATLLGLLMLAATLGLLLPVSDRVLRHRVVIAVGALVPVSAILALGVLGKDVVFPRYVTCGVPFILLASAAMLRHIRARSVLFVCVGVMLLANLSGDRLSDRTSAFFPDARSAAAVIERSQRPGDLVVPAGLHIGSYIPLAYYASEDRLNASYLRMSVYGPAFISGGVTRAVVVPGVTSAYATALSHGRRLWIVEDYSDHGRPSISLPSTYHIVERLEFAGPLSLTLAIPNR